MTFLDDRNKINKNSHKDTREGLLLIPEALQKTQVRQIITKFKNDWTEDDVYFYAPLWQIETLALVLEGLFHEKYTNKTEPLWFNTARNIIGRVMAFDRRKKEKE